MNGLPLSGPIARNSGTTWRVRRRIIYSTLLFCAGCIIYVMVMDALGHLKDSQLAGSIINSAFLLAGGVIGSYVFGAVWDDKTSLPAVDSGAGTGKQNAAEGGGALKLGTAKVDDPDK
jgi:hypothetical protein